MDWKAKATRLLGRSDYPSPRRRTIRLCHALQKSCILSVGNESGSRASHEQHHVLWRRLSRRFFSLYSGSRRADLITSPSAPPPFTLTPMDGLQ